MLKLTTCLKTFSMMLGFCFHANDDSSIAIIAPISDTAAQKTCLARHFLFLLETVARLRITLPLVLSHEESTQCRNEYYNATFDHSQICVIIRVLFRLTDFISRRKGYFWTEATVPSTRVLALTHVIIQGFQAAALICLYNNTSHLHISARNASHQNDVL